MHLMYESRQSLLQSTPIADCSAPDSLDKFSGLVELRFLVTFVIRTRASKQRAGSVTDGSIHGTGIWRLDETVTGFAMESDRVAAIATIGKIISNSLAESESSLIKTFHRLKQESGLLVEDNKYIYFYTAQLCLGGRSPAAEEVCLSVFRAFFSARAKRYKR